MYDLCMTYSLSIIVHAIASFPIDVVFGRRDAASELCEIVH